MKINFLGKPNFERSLSVSLIIVAVTVLCGICVKIFTDVDTTWDSWYYHLPFAARLWGIVPAREYQWEPFLEGFYQGAPLFAEWLQGLCWEIFGTVKAAALVSYFSLIFLIFSTAKITRAPWFLTAAAFLAIPLIQAHAISCYIDLPANVFVAVGMMLVFMRSVEPEKTDKRYDLCSILALAISANMRYQVIPMALIAWLMLYTARFLRETKNKQGSARTLFGFAAEMLMTGAIIFFVPLRNYFVFGHFFYPIQVQAVVPAPDVPWEIHAGMPLWQRAMNTAGVWFLSVTDATRFPYEKYIAHGYNTPWEVAMGSLVPWAHRMGGYNGAFVVFMIIHLMVAGQWADRKNFRALFYSFVGLTLITACSPTSFELRYYFYWIFLLIAANLYLLYRAGDPAGKTLKILRNCFSGAVLAAVFFVLILSRGMHVQPLGISLSTAFQYFKLNKTWLDDIEKKGGGCVLKREPANFMYAHYFHPERRPYGIISATRPEEFEFRAETRQPKE